MPGTEVFHHAALVPLAVCSWLRLRRGPLDDACWIFALAFAASWFADTAVEQMGGSWGPTYVLAPAQLTLVLLALGQVPFAFALLAGALVQVLVSTLPGPEVVITTAGSVVALSASFHTKWWPVVWTYCGVGTVLYLTVVLRMWEGWFVPAWYGYQTARLSAFGLFARAAWKGG